MLRISDLSLDDELKDFLPRGSDSERAELLANIQADGRITDPIIVWLNHGIVVDGQTRFDIWQNELGADDDFPHEIIEKPFESKDHVKAWMIRHQAGRRNWNTSQRAMMAAELAKLPVGSNQHSKKEGGQNCPPSIEEAAGEMSVSPRLVKTAKHVMDKGSATLSSAVKNGTVRASDADKITTLPKADQVKAVKDVATGKAPTVARAVEQQKPNEKSTDEHSRAIDRHITKLVASIAAAITASEEAIKAIDEKCRVSDLMRNRKKGFEFKLRKLFDECLDPARLQAEQLAFAWTAAKKQVDE